jgi:suppressor of G2 allele of SKP1
VRFSTRRPLPSPYHTRHEFYETDERLTLTVFDRGADPAQINVKFQSRSVCSKCVNRYINNPNKLFKQILYENGENILDFQPLKGQIDPEKSSFVVGKVKVEIRLAKVAHGRWGGLIGDAPDRTSICTQVHTIWLMSRSSSCQFFRF